jgi:hypothetical protein
MKTRRSTVDLAVSSPGKRCPNHNRVGATCAGPVALWPRSGYTISRAELPVMAHDRGGCMPVRGLFIRFRKRVSLVHFELVERSVDDELDWQCTSVR